MAKDWWKKSDVVRHHRGRWDKDTVMRELSKTRMESHNQKYVIDYLCNGIGLSELGVHRQQVYARVKKIVARLIQ